MFSAQSLDQHLDSWAQGDADREIIGLLVGQISAENIGCSLVLYKSMASILDGVAYLVKFNKLGIYERKS